MCACVSSLSVTACGGEEVRICGMCQKCKTFSVNWFHPAVDSRQISEATSDTMRRVSSQTSSSGSLTAWCFSTRLKRRTLTSSTLCCKFSRIVDKVPVGCCCRHGSFFFFLQSHPIACRVSERSGFSLHHAHLHIPACMTWWIFYLGRFVARFVLWAWSVFCSGWTSHRLEGSRRLLQECADHHDIKCGCQGH